MKQISYKLFVSIAIIHTYSNAIYSQFNCKPSFKQMEYLIYDLNSPRTNVNDQIIIENYIKIDEDGNMFIMEKNKELKYFSYRLSNDEICMLNDVFNGKKDLKKYTAKKKLDQGVYYAGYYKYLKYIDLNSHSDQISFIDGDLGNDLDKVLSMIIQKSSSYNNDKVVAAQEFEINTLFIDEVFQSHSKNKKLPEINLPPPPGN
jgi:hypothetical protein